MNQVIKWKISKIHINPLSGYLQKNKGSKIPLKKTKGYHLLKTTHSELQTALAATMNDK